MVIEDLLRWFYDYRNNLVGKGAKKVEEIYGDYTHTFGATISEQQFRKLLQRISTAESDVDLHHSVKYKLFGKKVRKVMFKPCLECQGYHPTDYEAYAKKIMSDQLMKGRTKTRKPLAAPERPSTRASSPTTSPLSGSLKNRSPDHPSKETPPSANSEARSSCPLSSSIEMAVCSSLMSLGSLNSPPSSRPGTPPVKKNPSKAAPAQTPPVKAPVSPTSLPNLPHNPLSRSTDLPPLLSTATSAITKLPPLSFIRNSINYGDQKVPQSESRKRRLSLEERTAPDDDDDCLYISDGDRSPSDCEPHCSPRQKIDNSPSVYPAKQSQVVEIKKSDIVVPPKGFAPPTVPSLTLKDPSNTRTLPLPYHSESAPVSRGISSNVINVKNERATYLENPEPSRSVPTTIGSLKPSVYPNSVPPVWGIMPPVLPVCPPIPISPDYGYSQNLQRTLSQLLPPRMVTSLHLPQLHKLPPEPTNYNWIEYTVNDTKTSPRADPATLPQVVLPLTQNLLRKPVQNMPEDVSDCVPQKKGDGQDLPEWMTFTKWGRRPKRRRMDFLETP